MHPSLEGGDHFMRMRRKPGVMEKLASLSELVLTNPHQYQSKWTSVFANDNPIHLELGTGKGGFITGLSQLNPQINYIGIERVPEILYLAATKLVMDPRPNVRLLMVDGEDLLDVFQPGEISRIYLNFSDPWPKTRHVRRRLTHPDFLKIYQSLLPPGGEIYFKTDNLGLFEYSLLSLVKMDFSLRRITYDLHKSGIAQNVMTEYEKKFSDLGQPIYRVEALTPIVTE